MATEMTKPLGRCEDYDTEPGVHYHAHDLPRCKEPAAVGWGDPPRWICLRHMEHRLAEARRLVDRAKEVF